MPSLHSRSSLSRARQAPRNRLRPADAPASWGAAPAQQLPEEHRLRRGCPRREARGQGARMSRPWEQTRQVLPAGAKETPVDLQSCCPVAARHGVRRWLDVQGDGAAATAFQARSWASPLQTAAAVLQEHLTGDLEEPRPASCY